MAICLQPAKRQEIGELRDFSIIASTTEKQFLQSRALLKLNTRSRADSEHLKSIKWPRLRTKSRIEITLNDRANDSRDMSVSTLKSFMKTFCPLVARHVVALRFRF